ncbi:hypothetical protein [Pantoea sp. AG702]|uniref:hypothetical protein n=1 Tax=Pantoea sp. AG702 TaxID=2183907 RepID=UPI000D71C7A7|nr:hypothetical protein [Pantoea sp. AG702]PWW10418.1 hypothetical protein DFO57_11335 [Pantoea sp. AG702]
MEFWENYLIAHVDCSAETVIFDAIKECQISGLLNGWVLENEPYQHINWWLCKGEVKVGLQQTRENIAMTSVVLPYTSEETLEQANDVTRELFMLFNNTNHILNSTL